VTWTYTFQARNRLGKLPLTLFVKTQWKGDTDVCLKNIFVATTRRWHTFPSTPGAMWSELLRSLVVSAASSCSLWHRSREAFAFDAAARLIHSPECRETPTDELKTKRSTRCVADDPKVLDLTLVRPTESI
jgi:hypothetical protein